MSSLTNERIQEIGTVLAKQMVEEPLIVTVELFKLMADTVRGVDKRVKTLEETIKEMNQLLQEIKEGYNRMNKRCDQILEKLNRPSDY